MQMGAALTDGGRRLDLKACEQYYEAAATQQTAWSETCYHLFVISATCLVLL